MLNIVKWWVHIVEGSKFILSAEPCWPLDSSRTFIWIPEIQSNTYLCRNWTSAICSIYNIASGIPSTSTKCNKIFSSRWVKVKLGIVYRWSVQVQGSPNISHEHTLFCRWLTNVRLQLEILAKSSSSVENWSKQYKSLLFRFNWFEELRTFDGWVFSFLESDF